LERLSVAVYQTDHWKTAIAPRITELLGDEKMPVTRLVPTANSVIRQLQPDRGSSIAPLRGAEE
jgi:hypothetical protein